MSEEIQAATISDLDALLHLEHSSFQAGDMFSRRQYRDLLRNPRATVRVIRNGDQLGASAVLLRRRLPAPRPLSPTLPPRGGRNCEPGLPSRPRPRMSARLYSISVSPACRGQGLGGKLLADAIDLCRREGIARLHLEVRSDNHAAIALYRKFGFEVEKDLHHYYAPGEHGVKMGLEIED